MQNFVLYSFPYQITPGSLVLNASVFIFSEMFSTVLLTFSSSSETGTQMATAVSPLCLGTIRREIKQKQDMFSFVVS